MTIDVLIVDEYLRKAFVKAVVKRYVLSPPHIHNMGVIFDGDEREIERLKEFYEGFITGVNV